MGKYGPKGRIDLEELKRFVLKSQSYARAAEHYGITRQRAQQLGKEAGLSFVILDPSRASVSSESEIELKHQAKMDSIAARTWDTEMKPVPVDYLRMPECGVPATEQVKKSGSVGENNGSASVERDGNQLLTGKDVDKVAPPIDLEPPRTITESEALKLIQAAEERFHKYCEKVRQSIKQTKQE